VLAQENKGQHALGASATQDVTQDALVASIPMSPPVGGPWTLPAEARWPREIERARER
jgi:hypothetical protein